MPSLILSSKSKLKKKQTANIISFNLVMVSLPFPFIFSFYSSYLERHPFGKLDPDPHQSEKQDPDLHVREKVEVLEVHFLSTGGSKSEKK